MKATMWFRDDTFPIKVVYTRKGKSRQASFNTIEEAEKWIKKDSVRRKSGWRYAIFVRTGKTDSVYMPWKGVRERRMEYRLRSQKFPKDVKYV